MLIPFAALALPVALPPAAAAAEPASMAELVAQDRRLAATADRLIVGNAALCRQLMPATGLVLHSRDQYGDEPPAGFAGGTLAVEAVVPDSPAAQAGIVAGDTIVAIGSADVRTLAARGEYPARDVAFEMIAEQAPGEPLALTVLRGSQERTLALAARPGCRTLVEILATGDRLARSDGRVIQVSYGLAERLSDEGLAAAVAHELAHSVLEHRRRLSDAGVPKGFLGELGGNRRRNRQAEVEADQLSVHLLANAGYDPEIAPRFWQSSEGRSFDAGIFRSAIYPSPRKRAELMQQEIDTYLPNHAGPSMAGHLLEQRDRPL